MPPTRRARLGAAVTLGVYALFVGFVAFWPVPVDRPIDRPLSSFFQTVKQLGIRPADAYNAIETASNVAFFVPVGLLLVLIVGRRRWWLAPIGGLLVSTAIELTQFAFLPARYATVNDVIANTTGALIGAGIGMLIRLLFDRRAAEAAARIASGRIRGRRAAGRPPTGWVASE